jgi:hypothetical protein
MGSVANVPVDPARLCTFIGKTPGDVNDKGLWAETRFLWIAYLLY